MREQLLKEIARAVKCTCSSLNNFEFDTTGLATENKQDDGIAQLNAVNSNLISIISTITATQDVEILLVVDTGNSDQIVQQIREYDQGTGVWTTRYEDVNGAAYVIVGPLKYANPSQVLNLILTELLDQGITLDSNESLLTSIDNKFNSLGQKVSANSTPVVLSTEQELIMQGILTAIGSISIPSGLALDVTLQATNTILTIIDGVLDNIKLDTANLDVALSTLSTEATQLLTKTVLDLINNKLVDGNDIGDVTINNTNAEAIPVSDAGGSITIDNINLDNALATGTRTHNVVSSTGVGSILAGSFCGSVLNAGNSSGTWNGVALPAGVSIPWAKVGVRDTYNVINYDATGTTFIIEYTT